MRLPLIFLMAFLPIVSVRAETIPLDQIWGYNLRGTKDIAGIPFPEKDGIGQTLAFLNKQREYNIEQVRHALATKPPGEKATTGFVIPGPLDSRALIRIPVAIRGKRGPYGGDSFPQDKELALVFFSHPLSYFARLKRVERDGTEITVYYQFVPHTTPESTVHFALIPLGELPAGEYHVTYEQEPIDESYRQMGFEPVHPEATDIVCRDFTFKITVKNQEEQSLENGRKIPLERISTYGMHPDLRNYRKPVGMIDWETANAVQAIIDSRSAKKERPGSAFIITGSGPEIVTEFLEQLRSQKIERQFSGSTNLHLALYTHRSGKYYIFIESVEIAGDRIFVRFRPILHYTDNSSFHFAVIPLGELPAGKYTVELEQLSGVDTSNESVIAPDLSDVVCRGISFTVKGAEP